MLIIQQFSKTIYSFHSHFKINLILSVYFSQFLLTFSNNLYFYNNLKSKLKNKQKKTKLKGENIHLEPFPTISVLSNPNSNNLKFKSL